MTASAGGFYTGSQGARVLGLGGASTAYINSIAGLSVNPGLLSQWGDSLTRLSFGGIGQVRRASFIGQDTYLRTDQELTVQPGGYFYATHTIIGFTHLNCKSALIGFESTFIANENMPVRAALALLANPCVSPSLFIGG